MPDAIADAFIQVFADTSNFDEDLRNNIRRSMNAATQAVRASFDQIDRKLTDTQQRALRSFQGVASALNETRDPALSLARAIERLGPVLREMGPEGLRALKVLEQAFAELDAEIISGPLNSLRRLDEATERFGQQVRASLGRAAVGGINQLEESFQDLRRTGSNEMDLLEEQVRAALNQLGNIPGLERLQGHFEQVTEQIRGQFRSSIEEAEDNLTQMFNRGELEADEFRGALAQVERLLSGRMEDAIEDVNRDLRLLQGHEGTFRDIARGVEVSAREMEQARVEARQLANSIDQVEEETNDASRAVRRFGRSTTTSVRRGNDAMGTFIARMNRVRFLALDLRFVLAGVGIFAAAQFVRFGLEAAASIEQARLSFQTLARSISGDLTASFSDFREEANVSLEQVIEFARETPFSLEQVTDAVRKTAAFLPSLGVASEEALSTLEGRTRVSIEIVEDLGAALAILGQQDALDRLLKGLGDVGAAGRLLGQDLRQLRNALPGINIREAIITGIFDPTVEATDSITFLREEFSRLGADASKAPTEATAAFVDLQRRGLISTEAVVQGLRASLQNLAGDDALEQFTLTIDGVIEKVREAAEVGSERGFRQLGQNLVDQVIPALEGIEDASENFAESFTDLATASIPIAIRAFEEVTDIAGDLFDRMAVFARENRPEIERAIEGIGLVTEDLFDILFKLSDILAPLAPAFLELVDVGLEALVEVLEVATPLLEVTAEAIGAIPPELLATTVLMSQFSRIMRGLALASAGRGFANLGASISTAHTAIAGFARFAGRGAFIGLIGAGAILNTFRQSMEKARDEAAQFSDLLLTDVNDAFVDLPDLIDNVTDALESQTEVRQRLHDQAAETVDALSTARGPGADFFNSLAIGFRGLVDPDFRGTVQGAAAASEEMARLEEIQKDLVDGLPILRTRLAFAADGFEPFRLGALLTDDALGDLLFSLDFTEQEILALIEQGGIRALGDALLNAAGGAGGLGSALSDAGIAVGEFDASRAIEEGEDLAEVFDTVATNIQNATDALRAQNDPVFAAADALSDLRSAEQDLAGVATEEFETAAERQQAIRDAAEALRDAGLDVLGAVGDLSAAAADPDIAASFENTISTLENLGEALGLEDEFGQITDLTEATFQDLEPIIAAIAEDFASIDEEGVELLLRGLREGRGELNTTASGMASDFDRHIGTLGLSMSRAAQEALGELERLGPESKPPLQDLVDALGQFADPIFTAMRGVGNSAIQGIIAGLDDLSQSAIDRTGGITADMAAAARLRIKAESPSQVFRDIGRDIGDGLILGVDQSRDSVLSAVSSLTSFSGPGAPGTNAAAIAPPPGASPSASGFNFDAPITVMAPSPERAARRVVTEVSDVLYLNTGKALRQ